MREAFDEEADGVPARHTQWPLREISLPTRAAGQREQADETTADIHVLRRLGEGGMGTVELAEQRSLHREVGV